LIEVDEVEAKWTATCRAIRARVLAVADRMRDLPERQHVRLSGELRAALSDLADGQKRSGSPPVGRWMRAAITRNLG